jgi:hypothetical protein
MTQRSQLPADRPRARCDSTRPPRSRRSAERAPYPGAGEPTAGNARGTGTQTRSRRRGTPVSPRARTPSTTPIAATVWATGPDPIDAHDPWPVPIVETAAAAFSTPTATVLLLSWPTPGVEHPAPAPGAPTAATSSAGADELAGARDAVEALGRSAEIVHLDAGSGRSPVLSRPFWADLITTDTATAPGVPSTPDDVSRTAPADTTDTAVAGVPGRADLIITSLPPDRTSDGSIDRVALAAARLLSVGGILAVYTHGDWSNGRLVDPTGPMVAAAQNADLLYLQHIITLHTPIRDGHLDTVTTAETVDEHGRATHRAQVHGLPAPHLRAHVSLTP